MSCLECKIWQPKISSKSILKLKSLISYVNEKKYVNFTSYSDFRAWSVENSEAFWKEVWLQCGVIGNTPSKWVIKDKENIEKAKFFPDAKINFAENLLRRKDDATAIHFFCEDKIERIVSYKQLYEQVSSLTQFFQEIGIQEGDRIGCYLPNIPQAIMGMLATATLGAIWSTCSPDFGVPALVDRFGQISPRVLFITDGYFYNGKEFCDLEKLSDICAKIPSIEHVIVIPFVNQHIDLPEIIGHTKIHQFNNLIQNYPPKDITFKRFPFNQPLYILYSSGTTGIPKCIVHGAGGTLLQHLKEHQLHCNIQKDDAIFYFTTCSWMMWHWLVSSLASEAKIILYDGSPTYPSIDYLFKIAAKTQVKLFGTSAKYLDNLSKNHVNIKDAYNLEKLEIITSTGSPLLPATFDYVYQDIKQDVCLASISGGTDIISCFVLGSPVLPVYRGEIQTSGLGLAVDVFDPVGNPVGAGVQGELVCTKPFPSQPVGFWNDPTGEKYHNAYFATYPNVWHHGDFIAKTENGGYIIYGRSDAVLNPGGVRIGTAEIYRQVEALEFITESLCVGQPFEGDERVILFVKLKPGITLNEELVSQIKKQIRSNTTPRHVPAKIIQVPDIPRTKNNKIAELAVKQVIMGRDVQNTGALLNPEVLSFYRDLQELFK